MILSCAERLIAVTIKKHSDMMSRFFHEFMIPPCHLTQKAGGFCFLLIVTCSFISDRLVPHRPAVSLSSSSITAAEKR
jgi:hypothetical protein